MLERLVVVWCKVKAVMEKHCIESLYEDRNALEHNIRLRGSQVYVNNSAAHSLCNLSRAINCPDVSTQSEQ